MRSFVMVSTALGLTIPFKQPEPSWAWGDINEGPILVSASVELVIVILATRPPPSLAVMRDFPQNSRDDLGDLGMLELVRAEPSGAS